MTKPINAILIDEKDNVATAILELHQGDIGRYAAKGEMVEIAIAELIPKYHKFSVQDIRKTEPVRKYGEVIGEALQNIAKGAHVHVHNIISPGR